MNDFTEVKLHFLDYWRVVKMRSGIILLAFLLVILTAGITTYFLPRQYFSKVTMEVKPDDTGVKIFGNDRFAGASDSRFAPTQFQIIQRKEVLYPVIENLKLQDGWMSGGQRLPRESVYMRLLRSLDMREVRNTDLIEIGVYSTDPQEAANIANQIAVVYQERRRADQEALMMKGLSQLHEQVKLQRKRVEEAAAIVGQLRVNEGIVDLNPETLETAETTESRSVLQDEEQVNQQRVRVSELRTRLEQIAKLTPEELMVALNQLNMPDPTVMKLLPLFQDAVAKEAELLNSGLGERHPKVTALRAVKDVYSKQLNDQMDALKISQQTQLRVAEATLAALEEKLQKTRDAYQTKKNQSQEYIVAKSNYIQAKRLLEAAEMRLSSETMQQQISIVPAKIWEKAEPSIAPAKPNVPAYMSLAVLIGLVVGVGLAFFIEYLDTSFKTVDDIERYLKLPVLAVIPKRINLLSKSGAESADAEAYRILRTNFEFNRKNPKDNTITVISGGSKEGKSTTIFNLAFTCAQSGYKVLMIDADLRRPTQHRLLDMENKEGLIDFLQGRRELEEVIKPTSYKNFSVMLSGRVPRESAGILNAQKMVELISRLRHQYDLVFVDSPPILGVSDSSVIVSQVDLTLMIIEHRRFPRIMLQRVKQAVQSAGGRLQGVVLNKFDMKHDAEYQYYSAYGYYGPEREEKKEIVGKPAETNSSAEY